jgi:hypothetical protein
MTRPKLTSILIVVALLLIPHSYTVGSSVTGSASSIHQYGCGWGTPGGSALTTGLTCYIPAVPAACRISGYQLQADAGTFAVKVWKIAAGTALPTVANVINTLGLALSSGTNLSSATVTDFTTTTVSTGDVLAVNVTAASGAGYIYGGIICQ